MGLLIRSQVIQISVVYLISWIMALGNVAIIQAFSKSFYDITVERMNICDFTHKSYVNY